MDQAKFVRLLESVLEPNTARVKTATATLRRDYFSKPQSLSLLLQILASHSNPQLRQLAATQARGLISKHWGSVPATHKPQIRTHLLQATLHEETPLVRHSAARVISEIAKIDLEDGEWTDLPDLMKQAATGGNVQEREVSTYILFTILESVGDGYVYRFDEFFVLFAQTIHDPESAEVRINTMLALSKMAMLIDADDDGASLEAFHKALPEMVSTLKQAIDGNDEERIMQGFEVFQTLLDCDPKLLNIHFRDLVLFMVGFASGNNVDKEVRTLAMNFLISCVLYRRLKFQGLKIGDQFVPKLLEMLAEPGNEDDGFDDSDDELSLRMLILSLLSIMATNLAPSQIMVPLIQAFKSYAVSPSQLQRQAAIRALGTCVDGAPDFLDTQLEGIIPVVLRLLEDPDIKVREAAANGTKMIADHLSETMGKHHQSFISALMKNLNQAMQDLNGPQSVICKTMVIHCCAAIDSLVDGLEPEDVTRYLPALVPHLSNLFTHPDTKIKAAAIGAVGSIAECAHENFLPYFEETMNALAGYVQLKESEDEMSLRAMTCDSMGNIATAVGAEPFQRYVRPLMEATEEGIHLDDSRLKETSYMLWGTLSKIYGKDFKPFLPGVVKGLFKSIQQDEDDLELELGEEAGDLIGQEVVIAGRKVKVMAPGESKKDGNGDTDEDDEEDSDWNDIGQSAVIDEKEVALESLGDVLTHTRGEFLPYLEDTIEILIPCINHPFQSIRRAAMSSLFRAYAMLWELQDESKQKWQPGLPLKVQPSNEVTKLGIVIMKEIMEMWEIDDDRGIILEINRNIADTLKLCGPALISGDGIAEKVAATLLNIVKKQHSCQKEDIEDDQDLDEEGSEEDWYVIESAFDAVTAFAKATGDQFGPAWKLFEKPMMQYASSSEANQRSSAVGSLADAIRGMKSAVTPFTAGLLKLFLHRIDDEDLLVKSNAAFAIGLLVEYSNDTQEVSQAYGTILTKLEPLLQAQEARQLDNAAGCISRMILKHKDLVPLSNVLPALVALLPLKEDHEENEPLYHMIVQLYSAGEPAITNLTREIIAVIAQVMGPPESQLVDSTREELLQLVRYVHSRQPALIQQHPVLVAAMKG